jgi:hypothetical protein
VRNELFRFSSNRQLGHRVWARNQRQEISGNNTLRLTSQAKIRGKNSAINTYSFCGCEADVIKSPSWFIPLGWIAFKYSASYVKECFAIFQQMSIARWVDGCGHMLEKACY